MTLNEIKKALYKEKPTAKLSHVSQHGIIYGCYATGKTFVQFKVPFADIGESLFGIEMPAQLLIRYIQL